MKKIVVFHSSRGGVGKSTLIANVAVALMEAGRRVVVVDADVYQPGQHALFNLDRREHEPTLNTFLDLGESLRSAVYELTIPLRMAVGASFPMPGELYLLPANQSIDAIQQMWDIGYDPERLQIAIQRLIEVLRVDFVLVDTHPGLNPNALLLANYGELLYLVGCIDEQCADSMEYVMYALQRLGDHPQTAMLFTRVPPSINPASLDTGVTKAFKLPVAGILPWDERIAMRHYNRPPVLDYPDSDWSRKVRALAGQIQRDAQR